MTPTGSPGSPHSRMLPKTEGGLRPTRPLFQAIRLFQYKASDNQQAILKHLFDLKAKGYRPTTLQSHSRILRNLDRSTDIFDPNKVASYIANLNVNDGTKDHYNQVYGRWAEANHLPYIKPKRHYRNPIPRSPTEENIDLLISRSTIHYATILTLLKETGIRVSELETLAIDNFDFTNKLLYIKTTKDGNPRILSEHLVAMLQQYFIHCDRFLKAKSVRAHFEQFKRKAFINTGKSELLSIRLHDFRHFYATRLYYLTHDILLVKKRLGHRSINSTLVYTQIIEAMKPSEYYVATASNIQEATKLLETGFEYVIEIDGIKIFRKPK